MLSHLEIYLRVGARVLSRAMNTRRISRLHCESESFKMDLILDINSWLYPMELGHVRGKTFKRLRYIIRDPSFFVNFFIKTTLDNIVTKNDVLTYKSVVSKPIILFQLREQTMALGTCRQCTYMARAIRLQISIFPVE
ncbi:uncharacterized protein LOC118449604 isoform X3 [Vespa mandarinia]|uniref:uncharacterized protein LOC118449604 isoform X3 n=1 Tax=Vespa mandarinia TaxID=7446 RepID=UPI00162193FD|nr:uncharacterized protein LOC118449604 isoform X3 [Vespa mandarinia]